MHSFIHYDSGTLVSTDFKSVEQGMSSTILGYPGAASWIDPMRYFSLAQKHRIVPSSRPGSSRMVVNKLEIKMFGP